MTYLTHEGKVREQHLLPKKLTTKNLMTDTVANEHNWNMPFR